MFIDKDLIEKLWLQGEKYLVICEIVGCSTATVQKVVFDRGLPKRGKCVKTALTEQILAYQQGTPYAVIQQALGCTAAQIKGVRDTHRHLYKGIPKTVQPKQDFLTDNDKELARGLFGHLSLGEIANKLDCTYKAVKEYSLSIGHYETKSDHLRALIAAGYSRKECLAVSGAKHNEYRRICTSYKRELMVKVGAVFSYWTIIDFVNDPTKRIKRYRCQCVCGQIKDLRHDVLMGARSASCGCKRRKALPLDLVQRKERPSAKSNKQIGSLTKVKAAYAHYKTTGCNIPQACKKFGISSATWYKYLNAAMVELEPTLRNA